MKLKNLFAMFLISGLVVACGGEDKENKEAEKEPKPAKAASNDVEEEDYPEFDPTCSYELNAEQVNIGFTGFKHSTKIAVPGQFRIKAFEGNTIAATPHELVMGLTGIVETNANSVFTNDTTRDRKLADYFFGVMDSPEQIRAQVKDLDPVYDNRIAGGKCSLEIEMNGVVFSTPAQYLIDDAKVEIKASIDLENWDAMDAHASINKACEAKHTLESDGEAITHSTVDIVIEATFDVLCQ